MASRYHFRFHPRFTLFGTLFMLACLSASVHAAVTVVKAPYLLWVTQTNVIIMWETNTITTARVTLTPQGGGAPILQDVTPTTVVAQASITGLAPGTRYDFSVTTTVAPVQTLGTGAFTTDSPGPRPMTFGVLGDTQEVAANFLKNNSRMMQHNPELVLHAGDIMTNGTDATQWNTQLFTPGKDMFRYAPMYVSFGNHESNSPNIRKFLPYPETMTGNPVDSRGHYYSATRGNAFMIFLDSQYAITPGSPQYVWLTGVLASTAFKNSTWRILLCHYPAYSVGWEGYDGDSNMRTYLVPLMEQNGIDLYIKGHTHSYERGYLNGVTHIINGGGAAGNETWGRNWPFIVRYDLILQYSIININGNTLEFRCYDFNNKLYDRFTLRKGEPFTLSGAPVFVREPKSSTVGVQTVTLKFPAGGTQRFRYRVAIEERRAEDGFWAPTSIMYPAGQEITLPVNFKTAGTYHVIAQALDAEYRASEWVRSAAVTIQ